MQRSFGFGAKQSAKPKLAPGPGEHLSIDFGIQMTTMNYVLMNGNNTTTHQQRSDKDLNSLDLTEIMNEHAVMKHKYISK